MTRKPVARKPLTTAAAPTEAVIADHGLPRARSLVFVSHDTRDAELAELFANLLTDVSAGTLKSFRSSDKKGVSGIEFGSEWYGTIMTQLGSATDVVALLTPHSLDRPWILYEAGVAKGKLDTVVFGVALGVGLEKVSTGPFGQFQNCGDDEDSLTKLVMQLLQRNPDASPREEAVRMQVRLFIERMEQALAANDAKVPASDKEEESVAKLFEEVKAMVRELPDRIDGRVRDAAGSSALRRMSRRSPALFEELLFSGPYRGENGTPTSWLMFVSLLRDDFPWLYELGMEIYREFRAGKDIRKLSSEFSQLTDFTFHSPMGEQLFRSNKMTYELVRHLPRMSHVFLDQMADEVKGRRSLSKAAD